MMTSRERLLAALDGMVPDRLPVSVHDWMKFYLRNYLGGLSPMDAFRNFSLEPVIYETPLMENEPNENWRIDKVSEQTGGGRQIEVTRITHPDWVLTQTVERDQYESPWFTEYLCKEREDIFKYLMWSPDLVYDIENESEILRSIADEGILRGCRVGPWHELCELYGAEKVILMSYDDPEWLGEALDGLMEKSLKFLETMRGCSLDLLETGGGHNSSTVISPEIFERFILPREKRIHDFCRDELGLRTVYHICGGMMPLLDLIAQLNPTAIETLTPPAMGGDVDLGAVKKRVGDRMSLIGGFDQLNGFEKATPDVTKEMVLECFRLAGEGGGYILNPSDHFFHCPVENLQAYSDAARDCAYT